jgi:uncharacterized phage protein (TIGR02220 family)
MARARNIKPSFFTNDTLAEVDPLGRLLFQGLWCIADREGRLEDRPKRIKAELLPYDNCDVDVLLADLNRLGFILRYSINGNRFIQVVNFAKHQNPHVKEAASQIPAPDEHSASTVQEAEIPEQAGLIPDSPIPLTDSGFSDSLIPDSEENTLSGKPDDAQDILTYLNEKTESAYRPVESNLKLIRDRLKSGATVEQVRGVIDAKVAQWGADPKMQEFLRPTTLFRASNFEQYLGQLGRPAPTHHGPAWHETDDGYQSKAEELGLQRKAGEPFQWFKWRVAKKAGDQGVIDKLLSAAERDGIAEHERAFQFFHGRSPTSALRAPEEA